MFARASILLALACVALLACGGPSDPQSASRVETDLGANERPREARDPAPKPAAPTLPSERGPVERTPMPGADAAGPVYFVINTQGVAKLDETGVTLVLGKSERNLQDLFVGPDGAVDLVDARLLRRIEGDEGVEVARFGLVTTVALAYADESRVGRACDGGDVLGGRAWERTKAKFAVGLADVDAVERERMEVHV